MGPTAIGTAVWQGVDAHRRRPRSGSVSRQIAQQRRGYAGAVLRALARTHRGRPSAVVQRVLREARCWVYGCPAPNFTSWLRVSAPGSRSPCREQSGRTTGQTQRARRGCGLQVHRNLHLAQDTGPVCPGDVTGNLSKRHKSGA
jgi:hypothetical protein